VLSAWQSLGSLLLAKCARKPRVSHTHVLADDDALGLLLGLTALPKATHLTSYSYRVRRSSNEQLLAGLTRRLRELGLATGEEGFNLDFHAIRHHGEDTPLEKHYVPRRSHRTRAMLTFFARDHASTEMVYANADLTKAEQAREIIAFADYWQNVTGTDPGLLVFDSKLTTYKVLSELTERGIRWLTLRERGPKLIADLHALPASEWKTIRVERSGRYRLWRHFIDSTGTLHLTDDALTLELRLRAYHPVLIDAGLADQSTPIPWLDGRQLRFRFPPR